MKKVLIVGNFKSNKTEKEASDWFKEFLQNYKKDPQKEIIICPSFTSLSIFSKLIRDSNPEIFLGAQNVSSFKEGPFTGEVNAGQIKEFCKYSLVGHSERRENFSEDLESINGKLSNLIETEIMPIFCISSVDQLSGVNNLENCIIAYEPIHAIGTGKPQETSEALKVLEKIKQAVSSPVLYGGGIEAEDVPSYTSTFDGILVGTNSLDPKLFVQIINNA